MIGTQEQYLQRFTENGIDVYCPDVVQTMDEKELIQLVPQFDGWIIGDDPATRKVFKAGSEGKLKAAVKWGIGVDNVDFPACHDFNIPVTNTPDMFGAEVADIAVGYVIALARETFRIDREIRDGNWPKYRGISLSGKNVGLVGYGDIGKNTAKRLLASDMNITVFDPLHTEKRESNGVKFKQWPEGISECDFLLFTCSLNEGNYHMLDASILALCTKGIRIINVARGPLINEDALLDSLQSGHVHSAALDVFEKEPLPMNSLLRDFPLCIFGSHNGSNTSDAVTRTNDIVINKLLHMLGVN
jgi:D-3-phosphoglycerate dehydrogenase